METFSTAAIWISIGVGLILLIKEQANQLDVYKREVAEQTKAVCDEIYEVCGDKRPVQFYLDHATRLPANLVYYALGETRQKLSALETDGAGDLFASTLVRLANDNGFQLGSLADGALADDSPSQGGMCAGERERQAEPATV